MEFSEIPQVLDELRNSRMIVLVDDEDRENEGDLVCAAENQFYGDARARSDMPADDGGEVR